MENLLLEMSRTADMRFSYKEQINMEILGNMFNIFSLSVSLCSTVFIVRKERENNSHTMI